MKKEYFSNFLLSRFKFDFVIHLITKKVNLGSISFLVPDPSQGIGQSVFVAPLAKQGNFTKIKLDVRFSCLWMSLHESKGKGVGLACSPVLLEGRNLSPGGKGFVPSIEASGIPMSLQEKTLLQFLILKSLSINTCCCYPPPAIWSIFPCIPPNYS